MTTSLRMTWGICLAVTGNLLIVLGLLLSFSLIGACIGVPMIVAGLPVSIWGGIWAYQARAARAEEAIAAGIRSGLAEHRAAAAAAVRVPGADALGAPHPATEVTDSAGAPTASSAASSDLRGADQ